MNSQSRSRRYAVLISVLSVAGLGFCAAAAGALARLEPFEFMASVRDDSASSYLIFLGGGAIVFLVAGLWIFKVGLDPFHFRRPRGLVYLNFLPFTLCAAIAGAAAMFGTTEAPPLPELTGILAGGAAAPVLLLFAEAALARALAGVGRRLDDRGSPDLSLKCLMGSLRLRPGDRDITRRAGALLCDAGRAAEGLSLLERVESVERCDDVDLLRLFEKAYHALGQTEKALAAIQRQGKLRPQTKGIERKLLNNYLSTGRSDEAIALLESGKVVMDLETLCLLQELYLKTGNFAQAMRRARQIAGLEPPPFERSIALYTALSERMPDNLEIFIDLALLLQKTEIPEKMEIGAEFLEKALARDPRRLHLRRQLAHYYLKTERPDEAMAHFAELVIGEDVDPATYLEFAELLRARKQYEPAVEVYRRMEAVCEGDWRGHAENAGVLLQLDRLDEAEAALRRAEELKPPDEARDFRPLSRKIAHRREELNLANLSDQLSKDGADIQKRLDYIAQLLSLNRGDEAVTESDLLLDEAPGMHARVVETLQAAVPKMEHSFRVMDYLADIYFRDAQYDDALKMYGAMAEHALDPDKVLEDGARKILARAPLHVQSRLALGAIYLQSEQWDEVLKIYQPLIENPPVGDDLLVKAEWTEACYYAGRLEDAMTMGMSILDRMQDSVRFQTLMIRVLEDVGEYQKAFEIFKVAFAAFPNDETLQKMEKTVADNKKRSRLEALKAKGDAGELAPAEHFEKADLHREFGQYQLAISHFQQASDDPGIHDLATAKIAVCLCERRLFELAFQTLKSIELTKDKAMKHREIKNIFYHVAVNMEVEDLREAARELYRRIFKIDASFRDIVLRLERLGED